MQVVGAMQSTASGATLWTSPWRDTTSVGGVERTRVAAVTVAEVEQRASKNISIFRALVVGGIHRILAVVVVGAHEAQGYGLVSALSTRGSLG